MGFAIDRSASGGGVFTLANGAALVVGGDFNFPESYTTYSLEATSTVEYDMLGDQAVFAETYGNLIFSGSGDKSMAGGTSVSGNLSIPLTGTAKASVGTGLNLSVGSLTLGGLGTASGTWGSTTATSAAYQDDNYFAATTGYLTVSSDTRLTPSIAGVTASQSITYGTSTVTLSGTVSATGPVYPADGETVTVTINGTPQDATISGGAGGFSVVFSTATIPYSATAYTITYAYEGNGFLQAATDDTSTALTVNKATVTAGLTGTVSKTYDGETTATLAAGNYTLGGVFSGDTVTLNNPTSGSYDTANQGSGKTVSVVGLSISGVSADNYTLASTSVSGPIGTIAAKELTVTGAAVTPKAYDGNTDAAITGATLNGVVGTEDVTLANASTGTFADKNIGTGKAVTTAPMTITGTDSGNYTLTQPTLAGDITAKGLTVTGAAVTPKAYDGNTDAAITGATLNGVVGTEDVTLANASTGTFADKNIGTGKAVTTAPMTITGTDSGNYTLTQPTLAGDITAKGLTVTGAAVTPKAYDGNTDAAITGATLNGVVGTEDVTLANASTGTFADKNIGTGKAVTTAPMTITGTDSGNYTLTQPTLAGDITAKGLTVTGAAVTPKAYDGNTDAAITGATLNGVVGTEDVTLANASTGTFADKNIGTGKAVTTAPMTITGTDSGNYTLTQPTLAGDITAKGLTVTGAAVTPKAYDGNTDAAITGATLNGVVGTEDVTLANASTGTFADKNIGTGKAVTTAPMTITGTDSGNYTLTQPTLAGDITAKGLTVTGAAVTPKAYDGNTDAAITGATLNGVVGTEDVTLANASTGTFADKNIGTGKAVTTAPMTITGTDSGNYTLTQPTLAGDITAKGLTVTGAAVTPKAYDGNTDAAITGATLNGVVGTEDVTLANASTGTFADKNIGTGKAVTTAPMTITGTDSGNYTLTQPTLAGDITAKGLTVTGAAVTPKAYDGNTDAAITGATLNGVVGTEDVTLANASTGTFADKNIGTGKAVTTAPMTITGTDSGQLHADAADAGR